VSEITEVLEPNIELIDWQTASETDMYTSENSIALTDIVMSVENTGNAPSKLAWLGYEAHEFTPEWSRDDDAPKSITGYNSSSPESQVESLSEDGYLDYRPEFKSDRDFPITLYTGQQLQLVDVSNKRHLTAGMDHEFNYVDRSADTRGWAVQEGAEYEFTVTLGTIFEARSKVTKTVLWENIGTAETLTAQPNDALISTEQVGGSE
jgi:hypothetical protein